MHRSQHSVPDQRVQAQQRSLLNLQSMFESALRFHKNGRITEAERTYRQILAIDVRHAGSLHMLGTLAYQAGRYEVAAESIRKAIAIDKRQPSYHSNLGIVLKEQGKLDEAVVSLERALSINPDLAEAHVNLGTILQAQGKLDEAGARFRRALVLKPEVAEVHVNIGNILQAQGKLDEAVTALERALTINPDCAEACLRLVSISRAKGDLDAAVTNFEQSLIRNSVQAEAHADLHNIRQAQVRLADAVADYERALALKSNYAEAFFNLGKGPRIQEKLDAAIACYQRALVLKPQLPEAHYNMGNALKAQDKLNEAVESYERALVLRPSYAEAHYNLACVLRELGKLDDAMPRYRRAIELKPDYHKARFGQSLAQLLNQDFASGWLDFESRWQCEDRETPPRAYKQPLWTGEKLTTGRLLIWGEQGVGDEVMFGGLIPDVMRSGNHCVLDCDSRLKPLFARSFPDVEVVSGLHPGHPLEAGISAQLPGGSLPGLFRTTHDAFAAGTSPYLIADPVQRESFRAGYDDGRRLIGLAWHTANRKTGRKRSVDLSLFAPLFALDDVRWVSLQYGDSDALEGQAIAANGPILIDRTVDQLHDIDRFAAQVAAMDMVITIDNSTAHLAGALGVPVWLLLPFAADWRWFQSREDSPWYPSMRLFRQPQLGDWGSVIENLRRAMIHGQGILAKQG